MPVFHSVTQRRDETHVFLVTGGQMTEPNTEHLLSSTHRGRYGYGFDYTLQDGTSKVHATLRSSQHWYREYALESGDHNTITFTCMETNKCGGGGGRDPDLIFVNFFLHSVAQYFFRRQLLTSLIPFSCDYFQSYCYH